MVQVTTRGSQPNEIGKFISRFDSKKDTKPTASNSREPSEGISLFLRKGSVGETGESVRNDNAGRMSCRSSLTREDPEKNSNDSNLKF
jgi:hypothetical protein